VVEEQGALPPLLGAADGQGHGVGVNAQRGAVPDREVWTGTGSGRGGGVVTK